MTKEVIATGKTVDIALEKGASELGFSAGEVKYEILEEPKKGILGIGSCDAKLRVYFEETPCYRAKEFLEKLIENMALDATVLLNSENEEGAAFEIKGEGLGILIGKHGDVLDSIQYLATLAANKDIDEFYRISVDIENYREKRAEALRVLARRMADKVQRYRRNFTLEPMNPYERRIIHSEIQKISGVMTYSVGQDNERKIVIALEREGKGSAPKKEND